MIHLYFLISAVIAQLFNPTAELAILTKTKPNAGIETQPLTAESKTSKRSK